MGALKWGLKAALCNLRTIVYNCALLQAVLGLLEGELSWGFLKGGFCEGGKSQ